MRDRVGRNFKEKKKNWTEQKCEPGSQLELLEAIGRCEFVPFFIALMDFSVAGFSEV